MRTARETRRIIGHHADVRILQIVPLREAERNPRKHLVRLSNGEPGNAQLLNVRHECPDAEIDRQRDRNRKPDSPTRGRRPGEPMICSFHSLSEARELLLEAWCYALPEGLCRSAATSRIYWTAIIT